MILSINLVYNITGVNMSTFIDMCHSGAQYISI